MTVPALAIALPMGAKCPLCRGGINGFGHTQPCFAIQKVLTAATEMFQVNDDGHRCPSGFECVACELGDALANMKVALPLASTDGKDGNG